MGNKWAVLPSQRRLLEEMSARHRRECEESVSMLRQHQQRELALAAAQFKRELGIPEETHVIFNTHQMIFTESPQPGGEK